MEFSIQAIKRLIRGNCNKRVSREAAEELETELQMYGSTVSQVAQEFAEKDGRKTVRAGDIKDALNADLEEILNER